MSEGRTLTSDLVGTNPIVISEWLSTHISHVRNQSSHHERMAQPLHLIKWEHIPLANQNFHALISDHVRTHLTVISERPSVLDQVFLVPH